MRNYRSGDTDVKNSIRIYFFFRYAFCLQALLQNLASVRLETKEAEQTEQICSE